MASGFFAVTTLWMVNGQIFFRSFSSIRGIDLKSGKLHLLGKINIDSVNGGFSRND